MLKHYRVVLKTTEQTTPNIVSTGTWIIDDFESDDIEEFEDYIVAETKAALNKARNRIKFHRDYNKLKNRG